MARIRPPEPDRPVLPYDHLDRADGGASMIWLALQIVAAIVVVLPLLLVVVMPFTAHKVRVDPTQPPVAGAWVMETRGGSVVAIDCPAPVTVLVSDADAACEANASEQVTTWLVSLAVIVGCAVVFLFANRRWRMVRRGRSEWAPTEDVDRYQQFAMPGLYWGTLALFGPLASLLVGLTVQSMLDGSFDGNAKAATFYGSMLVSIIGFYGWRHGYAIMIDGDDLVWRAPLRRRRVAIDALEGFSVSWPRWGTKERIARFVSADATVSIVLPDPRHEWQLRRLVDALRLRVPLPELDRHEPDAPVVADPFSGDLGV